MDGQRKASERWRKKDRARARTHARTATTATRRRVVAAAVTAAASSRSRPPTHHHSTIELASFKKGGDIWKGTEIKSMLQNARQSQNNQPQHPS